MPKKDEFPSQFGLIFHRFLNNFQSHLATHARHFSKLSCKPALSKLNGKTYGSASKMTYSQDRLKLQIQQNNVLQTPKNDIENTCQKRQECGPILGRFRDPKSVQNRVKIDTKMNAKFECILTSIFCLKFRFWGAQTGPQINQNYTIFEPKKVTDIDPSDFFRSLVPFKSNFGRTGASGSPEDRF